MVKETQFTLVPAIGWVDGCAAVKVALKAFKEEALVPLSVDVPMLHRMCDIGRLHHVYENRIRSEVFVFASLVVSRKRLCDIVCSLNFQ